jgi:hypothetical protein
MLTNRDFPDPSDTIDMACTFAPLLRMANRCMTARSQSAETGFRCIFRDRRQVARNQPMRRSTAEDRMGQVLFFEMNEVIFPYLEKYISQGHLPTFAKLFREYGYVETSSEERFSDIEPWIQWVSVRTGKTFKEHGVFRLGDMVAADCQQIWEHLEERGFRVGAISPMNAANRLKHPSFFMPDPWTDTSASGSYLLVRLYDAIKQAVNDNARKRDHVALCNLPGARIAVVREADKCAHLRQRDVAVAAWTRVGPGNLSRSLSRRYVHQTLHQETSAIRESVPEWHRTFPASLLV